MVFFSALWLGILTSISPCPLTTNIAAVSFLSKKVNRPKLVLLSGIFYTLGRMFAYLVLGGLIIGSLVSVPFIANFLQKYMNKALGPILILVGLFLLGVLKFSIPKMSCSQENQDKLAQSGMGGAFALGVIFALSFCPISAGLFFGSLIPLSLSHSQGFILPIFFGIGTGLPVLFFAVSIALGVKSINRWIHNIKRLEFCATKLTGALFVIVGFYFIWEHIIVISIS